MTPRHHPGGWFVPDFPGLQHQQQQQQHPTAMNSAPAMNGAATNGAAAINGAAAMNGAAPLSHGLTNGAVHTAAAHAAAVHHAAPGTSGPTPVAATGGGGAAAAFPAAAAAPAHGHPNIANGYAQASAPTSMRPNNPSNCYIAISKFNPLEFGYGPEYLPLHRGDMVEYVREEEGWAWGILVQSSHTPVGTEGWYPPNWVGKTETMKQMS
mmetsp:Transcript_31400/g.46763  ORF Transcript_31400/g.46763 Transcript_31400/m.46763 type:complete len:210 (+) Transcript_31400:3-632(+)